MSSFTARDGTRLTFHRDGDGVPLVCLPGGPMQASAYLDGWGLARPVVRLDLRGTGSSAAPADPATYRFDRQVDDVEALRVALGLDRVDLLGHSAGGSLAVLYAARHPERIRRLVLVAPSPRVAGIEVTDDDRRAVAELRRGEDWFDGAWAAFSRVWAGSPTDADWTAIAPFSYGRWDDAARANEARSAAEVNGAAAAGYYADGAPDPASVRSELAGLTAPVLLVAGEYDVGLPPVRAAEYAALFGRSSLVVRPASGHFPWLDDAAGFAAAVDGFLGI